jgi:predicted transcriptional regulator
MEPADGSTLSSVVSRRHEVLAASGPDAVDKRDLTDRLDVSRSTVDRAVRELERHGLVERTDGGVRRTLVGTICFREYRRTMERMAAVAAAVDVLAPLPPDTALDPAVLVGATVVEPTPNAPYEPVRYQNEVIQRADEVRVCATAVVPPQVEILHREVVENGLRLTGITSPRALDCLVKDFHAETVEALDTGRYEMYLTDQPVPYGVLVADGPAGAEMLVSVYDEDGSITGTVGNDAPEAVAWAADRIDRYLDGAERIVDP